MLKKMSLFVLVVSGCGGDPEPERDAPAVADRDEAGILAGPGSATHPAVSPDGTRIAFMSNAPGVVVDLPINFEIYVSRLDGTETLRLTENEAFDADIAWSPDGTRLVFKSYRDGDDEIYVTNADGTGARNLTESEHSDFQPHWSPSGAEIVFASDRAGTADLFVMQSDGSGVVQLIDDTSSDASPRWSPDGRLIAFVSDRAGSDDVFVMRRDGSDVRRLTSSPDADWSPRWSPGGDKLLYISGDFGEDRWDLMMVSVDGAEPPQIVVRGVDSGNASWHPDGERVFFGRYVEGESRLFSSRIDGSNLRPLAQR